MAVSEFLDKFGASTGMTITVASLASSTTLVGRQSTLVDNTTARYQCVEVFVKIKQGTSPTANRNVYVFLIGADNHATQHIDDGAGASDAAWTVKNLQPVLVLWNGSAPVTGDVLMGSFKVYNPGPWWGVVIVHDTGVILDATGSNHWVRYVGIDPEGQ